MNECFLYFEAVRGLSESTIECFRVAKPLLLSPLQNEERNTRRDGGRKSRLYFKHLQYSSAPLSVSLLCHCRRAFLPVNSNAVLCFLRFSPLVSLNSTQTISSGSVSDTNKTNAQKENYRTIDSFSALSAVYSIVKFVR